MNEILEMINSWLHRKEAEKFTTDGSGNTAVRTEGSVTVSGVTVEETKKATLLGASDLVKTFTYTKISNIDMITKIIFTSATTDTFYGETIDLTRTLTYIANKPPILDIVTDVLTAV